MITGQWFPEGTPPDDASRLWRDVFHWNEEERAGFESRNAIARAACLFDPDGKMAAAGRLYYSDGAFWLEALAVRADLRGQGYGDLLARMILDRAVRHSARVVRLTANVNCVGFFERYGFVGEADDPARVEMAAEAQGLRLGGGCGGGVHE